MVSWASDQKCTREDHKKSRKCVVELGVCGRNAIKVKTAKAYPKSSRSDITFGPAHLIPLPFSLFIIIHHIILTNHIVVVVVVVLRLFYFHLISQATTKRKTTIYIYI